MANSTVDGSVVINVNMNVSDAEKELAKLVVPVNAVCDFVVLGLQSANALPLLAIFRLYRCYKRF